MHILSQRPRVLVTGATGFIGKHFVRAITPHARVRVLARATSNIEPLREHKNLKIVYGDIDKDQGLDHALTGIDTVVHCAARTIGFTYREFYQTNVLGTFHLVRAMQRNAVPNILLLSTHAVSGPSTGAIPVCENDESKPVSHYGATKKLAEDIVKQSRLNYTILRPAAVYGPFDMDMLRYIRLIAQGICPVIGFKEKNLNLIYVKDLVEVMVTCITGHHFNNQTFFVHDGHSYRFADVVHTVANIMGKKVRIICIPRCMAIIYSFINEVFIPPAKRLIRRDKIHELACQYWLCSNDRVQEELGFKPQYGLYEGMKETIEWYRKHHYL
jgi:nucleoside-diphosphate-sugar epimerase